MDSELGLSVLRSPLAVKSLQLRNRIVMAPMTRQKSPGGVPGEDVAAYYAARARGQVGLIITEGVFVPHPSAGFSKDVPTFDTEAARAGWQRVTAAVHAEGGRIAAQLWHVGVARPERSGRFPDAPVLSPSGLGLDGTPAGLSTAPADIDDIVAAFGQAASFAVECGFDAVEVHGAHGYLVDQFLWQRTNRRDDRYGAGFRTAFASEIVRAIRAAVPSDFPVIFRFSQWKSGQYDQRIATSPDELESVLASLVDAGIDVLHASTRRYWVPEFEGSSLNLAGWAKKLTGLPSITVGSVGLDTEFNGPAGWNERARPRGLEDLLARLAADEFDLVAVGRALIADPGWAAKTLGGELHHTVPYSKDLLEQLV